MLLTGQITWGCWIWQKRLERWAVAGLSGELSGRETRYKHIPAPRQLLPLSPQVLSPPCLCTCCSLCPSLLTEVYSASSCPWVPPWNPPKQARSSHCKLSRYQVPVSFSARVPEELSFDVCDGVLVYLSALQGLLPAPAQGQAQSKHRTNSKQSGKGDTYRHQYDQVQW